MPNYNYVIDSSFRPFSMEEILTPLTLYKNAYDESEAAYDELIQKADIFSDLAVKTKDNPDSRAAKIYQNYADELHKQAADLSKHGLSIANKRALTSLKRRYQGEIGLLEKANNALQKEKDLRRQMSAKDSSMLYALDNLSIDDFLDDNTPNLYNISGDDLYARGKEAGKAESSRIYEAGDAGSTLGGYYRRWVERYGYSKESMDAFRYDISSVPELQSAVDDILAEKGVLGNLTGNNLERARQSVINGIIDGAVFQQNDKPYRDEGRLSAGQAAELGFKKEARDFERQVSGWSYDKDKGWEYDENNDIEFQRSAALTALKKNNSSSSSGSNSGSGSSTTRTPMRGATRISWSGKYNDDTRIDDPNYSRPSSRSLTDDEVQGKNNHYSGGAYEFEELPGYVREEVRKSIGKDGDVDNYVYYFDDGGGKNPVLDIIPLESKITGKNDEATFDYGD